MMFRQYQPAGFRLSSTCLHAAFSYFFLFPKFADMPHACKQRKQKWKQKKKVGGCSTVLGLRRMYCPMLLTLYLLVLSHHAVGFKGQLSFLRLHKFEWEWRLNYFLPSIERDSPDQAYGILVGQETTENTVWQGVIFTSI